MNTADICIAKPFVLLEGFDSGPSYLFTDMQEAIHAPDAAALPGALSALDAALAGGYHAAGWLAFEAGYALEPRLAPRVEAARDLLWFGLFRQRQRLTALEAETLWRTPQATPLRAMLGAIRPRWSPDAYAQRMAQVHAYILAGDIYQANLTFAADVDFTGTPLALYRQLRGAQRAPYSALIFTGTRWILSFSPEKFFTADDGLLSAQPMKGTAARHMIPALDAAAAQALQQDAKNRAENLMIVDLLRNDLARVSVAGSVAVPKLFDIISYPTVHQMVSNITATLAPGHSATDALRALFPCGSVTGAPKLRAMEIIHETEAAPRGIYCGAIGQLTPDGDAQFNVAIRTLDVVAPGKAVLGLGSGVVADSVAADEYAECLLKAAFLARDVPPFDLIETLRWSPEGGWHYWDAHMARLKASATYWSFALDIPRIADEAAALSARWQSAMRVRLLVSRFGAVSWQWAAAPPPPKDGFVVISPQPMRSENVFLYHKTSHRAFYDDERLRLQAMTGCTECLFRNERDEMTEGSFTTLFIRKGDHLLTPPISSGVLPGILRQTLLASGEAREAVLTLEDMRHADALLLGNAVRGLFPVSLQEA